MRAAVRSFWRWLPKGGRLPESAWHARHRAIVALLWLHVPAIILFGLTLGEDLNHALVETIPIASAAVLAVHGPLSRTAKTVVSSIGLLTSSAVLVHLSGGVIEAHFHFFVMVGVVVLYQEWWPYLVATGYVVLHHGVLGTLYPADVYNHAAAVNQPFKWAVIHGGFILAMSVAGVLAWRMNESLHSTTAMREQQLAEAQHLAHVGSWEWDLSSDGLEYSDEMFRLFGVEPGVDAPTFAWVMERIHPEDRATIGGLVAEARENGSDFATDFRFVTAAGEVRWMHGRGQVVVDQDGRSTRMRGTGHDITERKHLQAALVREAVVLRGLLQMVATTANQATTVDEAMNVAVEQVCALTGWPVGHAFVSKGPDQAITSTGIWHMDQPERFEAFRQATEAGPLPPSGLPGRVLASAVPAWVVDLSADDDFCRRDAARACGIRSAFAFPLLVGQEVAGVLEFFSTTVQPVDPQLVEVLGQLGRQLGLVVQRAEAAERLRASNERNRTIVETASDAFVEMDELGVVLDWNRQATTMFGWPREEALGRELAALIVPAELRAAHRVGLKRYLAFGGGRVVSNRVEFEALHRDGHRFPVEVAVCEVASGTGRVFNAFVRDTTKQKEVEEALASARDQAVEATQMKSAFLANMSHEIRTPMNGVIGLASLILQTPLDDIQRTYAEGLQSAGDALLSVINAILDFSKIEAARVDLEEVDFDLRELVEESVGLMAGPAAAKGLELATWCYPRLPTAVRGDPARLRQVLLNLVDNAVKFTERGQVVVQVRAVEEDAERVVARFDVVDTGIGIDAASHERVFASFSQADPSTTRRYGGTGLGLALVKGLVELMGGEIGVESQPDRGSTFWFTVLFGRQLAPTPAPAPRTDLDGVRALVVDDNATNRLILEQQLGAWGMRPETIDDPRQAIKVLREAAEAGDRFAVALVDMQMPAMDGLQVAAGIDGDPTLAGLPVILLSSGRKLPAADLPSSGVRASLMKPVRQSELYDALVGILTPPEPRVDPTAVAAAPASSWRGDVLVVEDNVINQTVACGLLARLGYRTDVAVNGREAVEAVARHPYAAVLMDCQMPEMDGYEATHEIRRRECDDRHVPIIAMTASAMDADRDRCIAAGMDDYIAKPVRSEEIESVLERWAGAPTSG
ncbi:MAG: response regulator [Acidimicrobiales bacterium]